MVVEIICKDGTMLRRIAKKFELCMNQNEYLHHQVFHSELSVMSDQHKKRILYFTYFFIPSTRYSRYQLMTVILTHAEPICLSTTHLSVSDYK